MGQNHSYHHLTTAKTVSILHTSDQGLNHAEVRKRRSEYGKNALTSKEKKSPLSILIAQVNNPVIYLLVAAVIVSFIFGDLPEAIAILVVILLNTAIGFWMEYRAQSSLDALRKMAPLQVKVIRNGNVDQVKSEMLVPGDLFTLEAGDLVPADARIISANELGVDESPLTGESLPVAKETDPLDESTPVAERKNMLFKGTAVTTGRAEAVVVATGMRTEIGNISQMVSDAEGEQVPLDKKLGKLARRLIWFISGLSLLFFIIGWITGKELYLLLQTAIAWTVAAIPEGLPIVASIALARGMLRLARQQVLVRRLSAVETLGETTVILTDKTGTLTRNRLHVKNLRLVDMQMDAEEEELTVKDDAFEHWFRVAMLCNNAERQEGRSALQGDPVDTALLRFGEEHSARLFGELRNLERVREDPFDSGTMIMGTIHRKGEGYYVAAKGAASAILERSSSYLGSEGKKKIDDEFRKRWTKIDREESARGLKVIGFAFRESSTESGEIGKGETDFVQEMVFLGIGGFVDPVREDIREPLDICRRAGIRIVMVTGDHPETARHIAKHLNLLDKGQSKVIHGKELKNERSIADAGVFARVDPGQKLDIVKHFQERGEIVGMTGDGVNDAPALKQANIGIAMGKRGTQVARDVADMVLQDDAFPSIVRAVEQGRVIFQNIKKFIIYQLSYHLAEILIIAAISFGMFKLPLLPLQLLFLNLLSDVFPALALGVGKGNRNIMDQAPKDPEEPIITKKDWGRTALYGVVISVYVIAAYIWALKGMDLSTEICNNVAFFSLAFSQLLHAFNMREKDERLLNNQVTRNKYIWMAIGFCVAMLFAGYFVPLLKETLSFESLPLNVWGLILVTSAMPLITIQLIKLIRS
jgi:Ca2+-transporting ATPase